MKIIKLLSFTLLLCVYNISNAEQVINIVEFFSFGCSHCYQSENTVKQAINNTQAKYVPVVVIQSPEQIAVSSIYTACMLKGIGWQFRDAYFKAVFVDGYPDYSPTTAKHVLETIGANVTEILSIAQSKVVQDKMSFDIQLIQKYKVSSTPTFVINGTTVLEGDSALNGMLR